MNSWCLYGRIMSEQGGLQVSLFQLSDDVENSVPLSAPDVNTNGSVAGDRINIHLQKEVLQKAAWFLPRDFIFESTEGPVAGYKVQFHVWLKELLHATKATLPGCNFSIGINANCTGDGIFPWSHWLPWSPGAREQMTEMTVLENCNGILPRETFHAACCCRVARNNISFQLVFEKQPRTQLPHRSLLTSADCCIVGDWVWA